MRAGPLYAVFRGSAAGGPRTKSSGSTGQRHISSYSSSSSSGHQPSRANVSTCRARVCPQPGPPAFAVLPVPFRALAVKVRRAGRLGDGIQVGTTAAPAAPGPLGQAVPGERPQRGRRRRGGQPGRPGHPGGARFALVEALEEQRSEKYQHALIAVVRIGSVFGQVNWAGPLPGSHPAWYLAHEYLGHDQTCDLQELQVTPLTVPLFLEGRFVAVLIHA